MMDERFSAYLDGEASSSDAEAVLSEMNRDPALRAAWGRHQWLRSALRDADAAAVYDPDFAERVERALDAEPATPAGRERRVVPFAGRRRWRAAASLAAAASVVGAVLLVAEPLNRGTERTPASTTVAGQTATPGEAPIAGAASATNVAEARGAPDHWTVSDPAVEDQLNGYLLEHNGLARGYGMSGATPSFLRVATYGQDSQR